MQKFTSRQAHQPSHFSLQPSTFNLTSFPHDDVDSTSDQAKRLARRYPDTRLLVTATRQSAGRGRSGRAWQSPAGGAWFTLAWPLSGPVEHHWAMGLLVGWAVLRSIRQTLEPSQRLQLKWPNDILLGSEEQKVAGVLCEQVLPPPGHSEPGPTLIVGVGINANFDRAQLDGDFNYPATTLLSATGVTVDLTDLIQRCVQEIGALLDSRDDPHPPAQAMHDLEAHLAWIDQPVSLRVGERVARGICRGVDSAGRLRLEVGGQIQLFDAGEVSQLGRAPGGALTGGVNS